jgi:hypothetical protein
MAKGYFGEGMGRPKIPFDINKFEEMCKIQCTEVEIAAVMGMSVDTLEKRVKESYEGRTFSDVFKEKREGGKESLRRAQWKTATESNNPIMQIFLGKNILGQADKQEIDLNANVSVTMEKALEDMD